MHDVVVAGAGLAGLTAARDLGRQGRSVLVLEARDRLGGRVWYRPFDDPSLRDVSIELGGTWVAGRWQPHMREEIARYRPPFEAAIQANVNFFAPGARVLASDAHDWSADPYTRGTWLALRPGLLTRYGANLRTSEGRIVMAGSDFATRWAGWMEGAIASGCAAAAAVERTGR